MLQPLKDFAISHGLESWARPMWRVATGKKLDKYDQQLSEIAAQNLSPTATCVDIGCHKGLILDLLLRHSPGGTFYGFEPIPYLCGILRKKYKKKARVHLSNSALWSARGTAAFYIDVKSPGLSGLNRRLLRPGYDVIEEIQVATDSLDNVLHVAQLDFIKIDVEGAEFHVLEGARNLISRHRPLIVFEHALDGASFYKKTPGELFDLVESCGLEISLMTDFLAGSPPLARQSFCDQYYRQLNHYFIAHPTRR
jgi:FkbM family methyltransferase